MFSLTGFELRKLWGRRSFLLSICTILLVNIFFYGMLIFLKPVNRGCQLTQSLDRNYRE